MGPLEGIKVLEVGGIGPGPFCAMVLAQLGAKVIRLQRPGEAGPIGGRHAADRRFRPALEVNLKDGRGALLARRLAIGADALIEGFRPGVMERLGVGPDELLAVNPRLVYGRVTGYGQDGPLAPVPGHDINYLSIAGVLGAIARRGERPMFPLNLLGDYGGGGMLLAVGVLAGLLEARRSGRGQVIDAAMVDGVALLSTIIHGLRADGVWHDTAGSNALDSGAPFYEVYDTADDRHVAVGAIEPQFYAELLRLLGIDPDDAPQWERERWPATKARFAEAFRTRTRAQWTELAERSRACLTPVLSLAEAIEHPHNIARHTFVSHAGGPPLPAAAPRFSRTPAQPPPHDESPAATLGEWGLTRDELAELHGVPAAGISVLDSKPANER